MTCAGWTTSEWRAGWTTKGGRQGGPQGNGVQGGPQVSGVQGGPQVGGVQGGPQGCGVQGGPQVGACRSLKKTRTNSFILMHARGHFLDLDYAVDQLLVLDVFLGSIS